MKTDAYGIVENNTGKPAIKIFDQASDSSLVYFSVSEEWAMVTKKTGGFILIVILDNEIELDNLKELSKDQVINDYYEKGLVDIFSLSAE
ncbi:MAG: hypothetical protein GY754_08530 [bacterium]|nr:hypothetical protein [bacterium]